MCCPIILGWTIFCSPFHVAKCCETLSALRQQFVAQALKGEKCLSYLSGDVLFFYVPLDEASKGHHFGVANSKRQLTGKVMIMSPSVRLLIKLSDSRGQSHD